MNWFTGIRKARGKGNEQITSIQLHINLVLQRNKTQQHI
jgi:hypothetical protein